MITEGHLNRLIKEIELQMDNECDGGGHYRDSIKAGLLRKELISLNMKKIRLFG
jgi:hypothetical protein|tara:strand:- start:2845 stop:3006 length:162 start_codon:yes stop_codon:yes gene_type:complete